MTPVAVVTGASSGLGAVLSTFLARQGFDLIITARRPEPLFATAEALGVNGASVTALPGDVSREDHRRTIEAAVKQRGRLDLLVNNASALGPSPLPNLADYPLDAFRRVLEVNLVAPVALTQRLLPFLEESGGLVVNITSDAAHGGYPGWGGYGASKAALELASLNLANELRDAGVSVVIVDPGDMRTDMHQRAFPGEDISDRPLPAVTLPFWAWLLGRDRMALTGQRLEVQSERWEVIHEAG